MEQLYQSKKDETIFAKVLKENEKSKTFILEYTTGEKIGKNFDISSATLKRWWKKVENIPMTTVPDVEEMAKAIKQLEEEEPEVFNVDVVNEETGEVEHVTLTTNDGVSDEEVSKYNFNPPDEEKKIVATPGIVKEFVPEFISEFQLASGEPFPDVEDVVDFISGFADVKRFGGFITLANKTKILFRRNRRVLSKSVFEIRMLKEVADKINSVKVTEEPLKGAMCVGLDFVARAKSMAELETLIKEISQ